jgi:hypothetical protein
MAYLSHGVIAAGRFHYNLNKSLGQKKLSKLKRNIVLHVGANHDKISRLDIYFHNGFTMKTFQRRRLLPFINY